MSEVQVSKLQNTSGKVLCSENDTSAGTILQVVQYSYTAVFENTTTDREFALPGVLGDGSASITLSSPNNRILFTAVMQHGQEATWRSNTFRVYYGINGYPNENLFGGMAATSYIEGANGGCKTAMSEYLTPPINKKGQVNFRMTFRGHGSGGFLHLNQSNTNNSSSANNANAASSHIILKEVYAP